MAAVSVRLRDLEGLQVALALARRLGESVSELMPGFQLALNFQDQGDYRRAIELLRRNCDLIRSGIVSSEAISTWGAGAASGSWLAWCLGRVGQFEEAVSVAAEDLGMAQTQRPFREANAQMTLGIVHLFRGAPAAALPPLQRALDLVRTFELPFIVPTVTTAIGLAYAQTGRADDGIPFAEAGVASAEGASMLVSGQALRLSWLGEVYLRGGRIADATKTAERALALARTHGERGYEVAHCGSARRSHVKPQCMISTPRAPTTLTHFPLPQRSGCARSPRFVFSASGKSIAVLPRRWLLESI